MALADILARGLWLSGTPRRQAGSATVEYVVVAVFCIAALIAAPSVIHAVWAALQNAYAAFYFALSTAD